MPPSSCSSAAGATDYVAPFRIVDFTVIVERRNGAAPRAEASVKVEVDGEVLHTAADGNGPVNALDLALRKALGAFYPALDDVHLVDYKVRIVDGEAATGARTRVIIETGHETGTWLTAGADANIIAASWPPCTTRSSTRSGAWTPVPSVATSAASIARGARARTPRGRRAVVTAVEPSRRASAASDASARGPTSRAPSCPSARPTSASPPTRFNYGTAVFEGIRAYRQGDGSTAHPVRQRALRAAAAQRAPAARIGPRVSRRRWSRSRATCCAATRTTATLHPAADLQGGAHHPGPAHRARRPGRDLHHSRWATTCRPAASGSPSRAGSGSATTPSRPAARSAARTSTPPSRPRTRTPAAMTTRSC